MRGLVQPIAAMFLEARLQLRMLIMSFRLSHCGRGTRVAKTAKLYAMKRIRLGNDVTINDYVHIWGGGGVTLGDHTLIASHVVLTSQQHDVHALQRGQLYRNTDVRAPIRIGRNVWVGAGAVVLPGVTIGDDAIVAAGAVVSRDVPPATLVAGVPARVVRALG